MGTIYCMLKGRKGSKIFTPLSNGWWVFIFPALEYNYLFNHKGSDDPLLLSVSPHIIGMLKAHKHPHVPRIFPKQSY